MTAIERVATLEIDTTPSQFAFQAGELDSLLEGSPIETLYPDEHQELLAEIPDVSTIRQAEKLPFQKKEKVIAMDLSDELRNIRELIRQGRDPEEYWHFFKAQAEYFGNETYGKLKVINYTHDLAQEDGELRLWISALGKSARESYLEAYEATPHPGWYQERCRREAESIISWEENLQRYLGHRVSVEISPAPFDVPKNLLKGTNFGDHSFLRIHQLTRDDEGKPIVFSRAFRTYLPPAHLSQLYERLTGEKEPPQGLLGHFGVVSPEIAFDDISQEEVPVQINTLLRQMEAQVPDGEKLHPESDEGYTSLLEMQEHYQVLEPFLRTIFNNLSRGNTPGEDDRALLQRVLTDFQTWEKMLKGRVNGEWQKLEKKITPERRSSREILTHLEGYYATQEYRPSANSCGGGSGFSGSSGAFGESFLVLSGTSEIFSGRASYEGISNLFPGKTELAPGECVTCPFCGNKKNNKLVNEKYICGNKKCTSNKKK